MFFDRIGMFSVFSGQIVNTLEDTINRVRHCLATVFLKLSPEVTTSSEIKGSHIGFLEISFEASLVAIGVRRSTR